MPLYTKSYKLRTLLAVFFLLAVSLLLFIHSGKTSALSGSQFDPGRIIDDSVFYNANTMSASQIQNFLNSKVPVCDTNRSRSSSSNDSGPPYICLKDYRQNTTNIAPESGLCDGYIGANNETAAQIIYKVSKSCGINPQVILVMLQKEQGLVTDTWPWEIQYQKAMGAFCPDTAPCDPNYSGFFYQVYYGAHRFKVYRANSDNYNYKAGRNNYILYNPNTNCGGSTVYIHNQATAGLYIYTPYQPNPATLAVGLGIEAPCGAYGNKNFWWYFNLWFGSPTRPLINTRLYDSTTDKTGERATIGMWLDKRPTANVTIPIGVYSPSNGRIVGGLTSITITPEWWDWPEKNIIMIAGKDNPNLTGTMENKLIFGKATSKDKYYNGVNLSESSVSFLHLDNNSPPSVYRLYKSGRHFFTSNVSEKNSMINNGWSDEGSPYSYCNNGNQTVFRFKKDNNYRLAVQGTSVYDQALSDGFTLDGIAFTGSSYGSKYVYWRYNQSSGNSLYTTSATEGLSSGYIDKGIVFTACENNVQTTYRLYRPSSGNYFLTQSSYERDRAVNNLGYIYEGTGFYSCTSGGNIPVYRLYNSNIRKHLYTTSATERDKSVARKSGWQFEGVAFSVCSGDSRPVYRLHKPSIRKYLYTANTGEVDKATSSGGYINEGIVFKVR